MLNDYEALSRTATGIRRLPINDFDLAAITHDVNKWQSHGKFAMYDITSLNSHARDWCDIFGYQLPKWRLRVRPSSHGIRVAVSAKPALTSMGL